MTLPSPGYVLEFTNMLTSDFQGFVIPFLEFASTW